METMSPIHEDDTREPEWEWDGLRRRRTMTFRNNGSMRSRAATSPPPSSPRFMPPLPQTPRAHTPRANTPRANTPRAHPPLGMTHFPPSDDEDDNDQSTIFSSIAGTVRRARALTNTSSRHYDEHAEDKARRPMYPVPLTEIAVPQSKPDDEAGAYYGQTREHIFAHHDTQYRSTSAHSNQSLAPTPPPHGNRRQFSFHNVFKRPHSSRSTSQVEEPTEEERIGLVRDSDSIHDPARDGPRDDPRNNSGDNAHGPAFL